MTHEHLQRSPEHAWKRKRRMSRNSRVQASTPGGAGTEGLVIYECRQARLEAQAPNVSQFTSAGKHALKRRHRMSRNLQVQATMHATRIKCRHRSSRNLPAQASHPVWGYKIIKGGGVGGGGGPRESSSISSIVVTSACQAGWRHDYNMRLMVMSRPSQMVASSLLSWSRGAKTWLPILEGKTLSIATNEDPGS